MSLCRPGICMSRFYSQSGWTGHVLMKYLTNSLANRSKCGIKLPSRNTWLLRELNVSTAASGLFQEQTGDVDAGSRDCQVEMTSRGEKRLLFQRELARFRVPTLQGPLLVGGASCEGSNCSNTGSSSNP